MRRFCRIACASPTRAGRSATSCLRGSSSSRAASPTTTSPVSSRASRLSEPDVTERPIGLERLELRVERLSLTFRFTYAFHAREVRFERDRGHGYERVFPETFSFHADRHDPAELFLQLADLAEKPELIAPEARRRDSELLVSRLVV